MVPEAVFREYRITFVSSNRPEVREAFRASRRGSGQGAIVSKLVASHLFWAKYMCQGLLFSAIWFVWIVWLAMDLVTYRSFGAAVQLTNGQKLPLSRAPNREGSPPSATK